MHVSTLEPYVPFLTSALVFVDGLLFGLAIKRGVLSIVLFVAAVLLASYLGLSLISFSIPNPIEGFGRIAATLYERFGPLLASFPILFVLGIFIGIWKG